jgi:3-oxoacyl-[acyl-carrier-protein] synthase-3
MEKKCNVGIIGMGYFIPEKIITNYDLEKIVETSHDWIIQRTGISERHIIEDGIPAYTMGVEAAKKALDNANLLPEDIDLIVATTYNPDYCMPSTACMIQGAIGAKKAAAFDISAACTGFIYGMVTGQQFISSGYYKNVLVVNVEAQSRIVDWTDRNSCILFGDGAAACVLSEVPQGYGIIESFIGADGTGYNSLVTPCCFASEADKEKRNGEKKMTTWLDGSEVMKFAVRAMVSATNTCLEKANIKIEDIDLIVPHQANIRIIEGAVKRLGIPNEKVAINIKKYGNMSSASIPVALAEAEETNIVKNGDYMVFVGFGGGLTYGSILYKWYKSK